MGHSGQTEAALRGELEQLRARVAELEDQLQTAREGHGELLRDATHDELTGLYSHAHLLEHLSLAIRSAKRYNYPLSICVCNLSGIDAVRETQGDEVADEVLVEFGTMVTDELRGDDIGGRYGRQGFCIVFPHTNPANAAIAMERVRRLLEGVTAGLPIQSAFGVSALASKETQEADLLKSATEGMREAEEAGGNRIVVRMP